MKSIQEYRADLGLSVKELLAVSGWSLRTYKRIRSCERELTPLERLGLESLPKKRGRKKVIDRNTNLCNGCLRTMGHCQCKPGGFQGVVSYVIDGRLHEHVSHV